MRVISASSGVMSLVIAAVCSVPVMGQVERLGYDSLPTSENGKARWLLGVAQKPETYETLTKEQRSTYEAIIHALDSKDLLGIVDAVTMIWGVPNRSGHWAGVERRQRAIPPLCNLEPRFCQCPRGARLQKESAVVGACEAR